jgi:hypothetical protein
VTKPAPARPDRITPSASTPEQTPALADAPWEVAARSGPVWVVLEPEDERTVLAAVNGKPITRADVKRRTEYLAKVAFAEGRARGQRPSRSMRPDATNVLDQLVSEALLLQEAERSGAVLTGEVAVAQRAVEDLYRRLPAVYRMDPPSPEEGARIARGQAALARALGVEAATVTSPEASAAARKHLDELAGKATITRAAPP